MRHTREGGYPVCSPRGHDGSTMFPSPPSRRQVLQSALVATACSVLPQASAQGLTGPAYEVSTWGGPVSALALPDITGKIWRVADFKGRAVLLNFWASWCEPCRAEMPTLQQLADFYGPEKLLVLAINFKEPAARAIKFAQTTGVTVPVLLDTEGKLAKQWGIKVFPTTLMIDSQGKPRQRVQGEVDWTSSAAEKLVAALTRP
ncbi:MAG: TlpA disulfide reductase family protein [Pseudomonadota bacterium]